MTKTRGVGIYLEIRSSSALGQMLHDHSVKLEVGLEAQHSTGINLTGYLETVAAQFSCYQSRRHTLSCQSPTNGTACAWLSGAEMTLSADNCLDGISQPCTDGCRLALAKCHGILPLKSVSRTGWD